MLFILGNNLLQSNNFSSLKVLPFRDFLRLALVFSSIDLTDDMYKVLCCPSIMVVIPGFFN